MRIAKRLIQGVTLPVMTLGVMISPSLAANVLQCVPYARDLSGIHIHGDAWTWWKQAKGNYKRGNAPKPGAVLALANSNVMPLGHVAVVSRVVDDRHILLRHANWSGPGLIEQDVLAVDASPDNNWSQVRIWWGQGQQMGARINPVNGFIYPRKVREAAVLERSEAGQLARDSAIDAKPGRFARAALEKDDESPEKLPMVRTGHHRLTIDPALFHAAAREADMAAGKSAGKSERTLAAIMRDVKREARLR